MSTVSSAFGAVQPALQEINEAIKLFDKGNKGRLDRTDFKCAFVYLLGVKPSKQEVRAMFAHVGESSDTISHSTFAELMMPYMLRRSFDEYAKEMFDLFDPDRTGFISRTAFRDCVAQVQPHVSVAAADQAFCEIDVNRYGRISLRQFTSLLHGRADQL